MNPLAEELNEQISANNPHTLELLSDLGKNLFFPKGILTQSAEAKDKAHKFNATIGIATENGGPMFLQCIQDQLPGFGLSQIANGVRGAVDTLCFRREATSKYDGNLALHQEFLYDLSSQESRATGHRHRGGGVGRLIRLLRRLDAGLDLLAHGHGEQDVPLGDRCIHFAEDGSVEFLEHGA